MSFSTVGSLGDGGNALTGSKQTDSGPATDFLL